MVSEQATPSTSVQSLARGLAVISCFDAEHVSMTLSEVAARTELSRATARRFLLTLQELGYVRSNGKHFELTSKVLQLGYAYLSSATLPQLMEPVLEDLSAKVHESASASVLDGNEIVYVARVHTRSIMRVGISVGTRFPAVNTSMGRVLLAFGSEELREEVLAGGFESRTGLGIKTVAALRKELEKIRTQGYAVVDQELEIGLRSVAVPIFNADNDVVAAMNVSMSVHPTSEQDAHEAAQAVLPQLLQAADQVRQALISTR
ncbi:IclR family transcriptional regulator domain-containing protein [Arthrobacter sp. NIO-1057]|uniref:IclR family transcriptional regulator domain-containing protein n=1 Tax=Arthrobacter sp. NIO-1057 TaxID=993071 RepID=UPI00071D781A|nr:IclR family transcriptional regulator C-terminal domain-containing protein [Arthrobacter sp. NIO-1057]KSU65687.1 IclR family transcriptional regulator [Arthrobacter sp. NIO-1057]